MQANETPIGLLIARVGLDGHDGGVKIVARTRRDTGMDVIYTGLHRKREEVGDAAIQEDVDVIGVSLLPTRRVIDDREVFRDMNRRLGA